MWESTARDEGTDTLRVPDPGPEGWGRVIAGFVGLGLALRLAAYLLDFPLWWDEAFVAVNLLRRGYSDLLRPLDYGQVCPLLFLWAELAAVRWLGFSEWSLRLFPLLCSLASVGLFRVAAGGLLRGRALLLAVAVFAVSVHPIRHAADVKPYASDLLVALVLQMLALAWLRERHRASRLWALAAFAPVALLLSNPGVFVAGGVAIVLAWPAWRTRRWDARLAFLAYGISLCVTYGVAYVLVTRGQVASASPGMREMWTRSFPPMDSAVGFARWLAVAHGGDMLAYPCGGENGASGLSLVACIAGSVVLWRRGRLAALGCFLAPLGLAMVAAALRLYPYGGPAPHGSSARIMQYAAPGICLLIGLGRIGSWGGSVRSLCAIDSCGSVAWAGGGGVRPHWRRGGCTPIGPTRPRRLGGSPGCSGPRWAGGPRWPACGGITGSPSGTRSAWGSRSRSATRRSTRRRGEPAARGGTRSRRAGRSAASSGSAPRPGGVRGSIPGWGRWPGRTTSSGAR